MADFIFCPRCGAVTKPGICSNCGYKMEEYLNEEQNPVQEEAYDKPGKAERKGSGNGWIVGLIVGIIVVVFLVAFSGILVLVGVMPLIMKTVNGTNQTVTATAPTTTNPGSLPPSPNIPGVDGEDEKDEDEDEDEKDDSTTDGTDKEDDSDYTFEQFRTIGPIDQDSSEFNYDEFSKDILDNSNEYWDENKGEEDMFVYGDYSMYSQSGSSHDFAPRDGFATPYYQNVINSYVENKNYDVERRTIRYEGEVDGVYYNAYGGYYALSSDKIDYSAVNEELRNHALELIDDYMKTEDVEAGSYVTMYIDSVVTYNNDEIFSVAYDTNVYVNNYIDSFSISGRTVDVKNAVVMDNSKILNFDDDFSKFFVERSNTQNRWVDSINESDVSDITKVFNDDDSLILFFTPLGIEVGINYKYYGYHGWVTITLNDFDQYFSGNYNFDTTFGQSYDIYQYEKDHNITPNTGYDDYDDIYYDL